MKKEFINGNPLNGVIYDFKFLRKEYQKLKCPPEVYNPCTLPYEVCKWFVILSERARGKTTNLLLMGLLIFWHYRTGICYIRSNEQMITPKNSKDLFSNIISWGYVEKITEGKYNTIIYKSRRWYFARADEKGDIEEQMPEAFCIMLSIDKNESYKSVLETKNDFIVFDEFIERFYYPQQFIMLCDLIKTISRERLSPMIFCLANNIDKNSPYFSEWGINTQIDRLQRGENEIVTTVFGTKLYVEMLGELTPKANRKREKINRLFYGFSNPKLSSITGLASWATYNYPHTPENFKIIQRNHYLEFNDKLIALEICQTEDEDNIFINCHPATQTYDDSVIYSTEFTTDRNGRYLFGHTKIDKFIWEKYRRNLFTYSDNSVGALVDRFVEICKKGVR
jgi:hypothetical protein